MLTLIKVLVGSGAFTATLKQKMRNARQTATVLASLGAVALVAVIVGAVCFAASAFLALQPLMADYQAALLVGGGFIGIAGIMVLIAVLRLKGSGESARSAVAVEGAENPVSQRAGSSDADPLVRLIGSAVQSPVIMTALALGIVAGRATKRSRHN
jgi:hypothetical protein